MTHTDQAAQRFVEGFAGLDIGDVSWPFGVAGSNGERAVIPFPQKGYNDGGEALAREVRRELQYCPETGLFTRKVSRGSGRAGAVAGTDDGKGYLKIQVLGRRYRAHRLAWLYVYGHLPDGEIDHINGNKSDNRIANLRVATPQENSRNRPTRIDNAIGLKGVSFHRATGKYRAKISHGGREHSLGLYESPESAHAAYVRAANENFGEFARAS